jgi:CHAD domain-containing protein
MKTKRTRRPAAEAQRPRAHSPMRKASLPRLSAAFYAALENFNGTVRRVQKKLSGVHVHETRVAGRRLLAWLELLTPVLEPTVRKELCGMVKKHLRALGNLRDVQVQRSQVKPLMSRFAAARPFCHWLSQKENKLARKAGKRLQAGGGSQPWRRVERRCRRQVSRALEIIEEDALAWLILQRVELAQAEARDLLERVDPAETSSIHRTRIAFKKLRYMLNALGTELPAFSASRRARMQRYQSIMGRVQDLETLLARFEKYQRRHGADPAADALFRGALIRRRDQSVQAFLDIAGRLEEYWVPIFQRKELQAAK